MAVIRLRRFGGEIPQLDRAQLPDHGAQFARNLDPRSSGLRPLRGIRLVEDSELPTTPVSIYQYTPGTWFEWTSDVNVVKSVVANDSFNRVYWTGDGSYPKVTHTAIAATAAPYPTSHYRIGVPAPASAPTLALGGTGSGTAETRYYVNTLVNSFGEEGPPSPVSTSVTWLPGQYVTVTMAAAPTGAYSFSYRRIYRSVTVGANKVFQFVAEVPIATTVYIDSIATADLGEVLPSETWDPPPDDAFNLVSMAGEFLAAVRSNELLFSEVGLAHAWPEDYRRPLEHKAVGIGVMRGGSAAVLTEGAPTLISGLHPASLTITPVPHLPGCVAKRGIVAFDDRVVYPTERGLAAVTSSGAGGHLTDLIFTQTQWTAMRPDTLRAFRWLDRYLAFYADPSGGDKGFLFNPMRPEDGVTYFEGLDIGGGVVDPKEGTLYVAFNRQISEWDAGEPVAFAWQSKHFELATPQPMGVVQVRADKYPVTVFVFRDGRQQCRVQVDSAVPRRLTNADLGRAYSVRAEAKSAVAEIILARSMDELSRT